MRGFGCCTEATDEHGSSIFSCSEYPRHCFASDQASGMLSEEDRMSHPTQIMNASWRAVAGAFAGAVLALAGVVFLGDFIWSYHPPTHGFTPLFITMAIGAVLGVVIGVFAGACELRGTAKGIFIGILVGAVVGIISAFLPAFWLKIR